jgi:hypothetical protein
VSRSLAVDRLRTFMYCCLGSVWQIDRL